MKLTAGFLQFQPVFGDIDRNVRNIDRLLSGQTFDLMVLPELCSIGYCFLSREELFSLSELPDGRLGRKLQTLAKKKKAILIAGFAERAGNLIYNSAMTVGPTGILSVYRKAHLFFREKQFFAAGNSPFIPVDTGMGYHLGVMICFDWMFPEAARSLALGGAKVIAHPANLVMPWCQRAMFARSVENRVFTITANRFGTEIRGTASPVIFTGGSQILAPEGTAVAKAGPKEETVMIREIDLSKAIPRLNPENDLFQDRRPDLYRL